MLHAIKKASPTTIRSDTINNAMHIIYKALSDEQNDKKTNLGKTQEQMRSIEMELLTGIQHL